MSAIDTVIQRAASRLRAARLLHALGAALLAAAGLALLGLAVQRLLGEPVPVRLPWLYGGLAAVAVLVGVVLGVRGGRDRRTVAVAIDQRLGFKDALATALYLQEAGAGEDPQRAALARRVQEQAAALAAGARVEQAFPVRFSRSWHYLPVLVALVALLHLFLPAGDLLGRRYRQQQLGARQQEEAAVREQLIQAQALIEEAPRPAENDLAQADPEDLLAELASLSRQPLTSPKERGEAAARLSAIQERLQERTAEQDRQLQNLKNTLSRLETERSGPADAFADALRRGDFAAAQQALDAMSDQLAAGQLSETQRQVLEEQMLQMAEQLEAQALAHQAAEQAAREQMQQTLEGAGYAAGEATQLAQQLASGTYTTEQLAQQIQSQQALSEEEARQLAQQLQQQAMQLQQAGQCASCMGGMASGMNQMAQSLSQGQTIGPGAFATQQQLQQMAQIQQQLQQMQMAQGQVQQAMQGLAAPPAGGAGAAASGGQQAGSGSGGPLLASPTPTDPYQSVQVRDVQQRQGRIIASWMQEGGAVAGPSRVEFDTAVDQARVEAERAVTDDRVPRRYHEHIRSYFQQLPEDPQQVRQPPPAPR